MRSLSGPQSQGGVMLIEALIGILIFSIGILALIGMQGVAVKSTTDSRYRSEAAYLATQLVGQMWIDMGPDALNLPKYDTTAAVYAPRDAWRTQVQAALPGVDLTAGTLAPEITVNAVTHEVKVVIQWKQPGETQARRLEFNNRINPGT